MNEKYPEYYEIVKGRKMHKPLNRKNWWYVQLNASIITAFGKYRMDYPKCVFVDVFTFMKLTQITIVRNNIKNSKDAKKWYYASLLVESALKVQAEANSTDEMTYEFRII